jgi:hypothetical protein
MVERVSSGEQPPMYGYDHSSGVDEPTASLPFIPTPGADNAPWWRRRVVVAAAVSFLAVVLVGTGAFLVLRPNSPTQTAAPTPVGTSTTTTGVTPTPTSSPSPSASPTPSPSPSPARTSNPVPTAPPTVAPPPAEQPPPPEPAPPPAPDCPTYDGENAPFAEVRAALQAAASKYYWQGVSKPVGYVGDGTDVAVPFNFVKAIAWQESGWQSAIRACDGGMGTMQLMPGTIDHLNVRFGTNYTIPLDLRENTEAGVNYLQWLLMYFGLYYYGHNFDPFLEANVGPNGEKLMLIDVVVAAYNVGPGALEREANGVHYLQIPNWNYVNAVWRFAMQDCPCDAL